MIQNPGENNTGFIDKTFENSFSSSMKAKRCIMESFRSQRSKKVIHLT